MPVDNAVRRGLVEQAIQTLGQIVGNAFAGGKSQAQGAVDTSLVSPVAAQIQAFARQHQWPALRVLAAIDGQCHQAAGGQGMAPMGAIQAVEQLRWQQHDARLRIAFGRQRQSKVRRLEGFEQVQAHMTVAQLVAGQGGGQQHQGISLGIKLMEEADEGFIQRTQPAALHPEIEQLHQVGGATEGRQRLER